MMISDHSRRGFTLIEVVVVLAVLGLLLGAAMPMVGAFVDQGRFEEARGELRRIAVALEEYYHDKGRFPARLDASDFLGVYISGGVDDTTINDGWGPNATYVYELSKNPDVATITSRGPNGRAEGGRADDIQVRVPGSAVGNRRTRARVRIIVESLAEFIEAGGKLSGSWTKDMKRLGLAAPYDRDGFGSLFRVNSTTLVVQSAGADRRFGTKDDITS